MTGDKDVYTQILIEMNVNNLKENFEDYDKLKRRPYLSDIIFHNRLKNVEKILARTILSIDREYIDKEDVKILLELIHDESNIYDDLYEF